jgi:hypothetical protein
VFKVLGSLAVSATTWFILLAGEALARGEGERVGKNLGDLLSGWSKSLYLGIAAIVALVFLLNRRFADMAVFMLAAVIVGGFVFAPTDIAAMVRDLWRTITA